MVVEFKIIDCFSDENYICRINATNLSGYYYLICNLSKFSLYDALNNQLIKLSANCVDKKSLEVIDRDNTKRLDYDDRRIELKQYYVKLEGAQYLIYLDYGAEEIELHDFFVKGESLKVVDDTLKSFEEDLARIMPFKVSMSPESKMRMDQIFKNNDSRNDDKDNTKH